MVTVRVQVWRALRIALPCRMSLLSIYIIMHGPEEVTRKVAFDERNESWQVVRILSPRISSTSIFSIEAASSVEMQFPINSFVSRVGHIHYGGYVEILV